MTLNEILEQAKTLSPAEQTELAHRLLDMADDHPSASTGEHWGQSLNHLMDEIGPIEMKYPEIEDPVEWVKHLRAARRQRRLGSSE
ncbi:MAG: hypothetical protein AAF125_12525 [Chloroflexota bacterium]